MTRSTLGIAGNKSRQFAISAIDTIFSFRKPVLPLAEFVDCFWLYEGREAQRQTERILPTGTLELVINLRQNELRFYDGQRPENCSRFSGAVVSGAHGSGFTPAEETLIMGVHFKPGGAFPFLGLPAGELADTHVDLETLWGSSAGQLRERLSEAGTSAERFQVLEQALVSRLYHGVEKHYAVSAALDMFGKNQCRPTVREAAKYLGLSQRRFIEVFKAEVGLTPKLFSRIQRFQQTRSSIQRNCSPNWAALAFDLGYFDQSHLIREFLEFSGLSPTDYLNHLRPKSPFSGCAADVRRGSASPVECKKEVGLCPWYGLWPRISGRSPNPGPSPFIHNRLRRGGAPPHIPAAKPLKTSFLAKPFKLSTRF